MIKAQVTELLQKEMDRKEFLRHVGIAAAVIVGLPTFLSVLSRLQGGSIRQQTVGYGSSPYGGNNEGR